MFTKSVIVRLPFVLAAPLVTAPLAAQEPVIVEGQPVIQQAVNYTDLDLRHWSEQQTLKARVHRASENVCAQAYGRSPYSQYGLGSSPSCSDLTYKAARPQITAAIERAKSGQPQIASELVIQSPARTR
ncbi:MAG: UrcA family protein [Novosphingobium sp.]